MSFLDKYVDFLGKYLSYYKLPCACNLEENAPKSGGKPSASPALPAFVYSDEFAGYTYGADHPMRPLRLRLTFELIKEHGLLTPQATQLMEARAATEEEILTFHTREYLDALKAADNGHLPPNALYFGLGHGDNPAFEGVYRWSALSSGASVEAAESVSDAGCGVSFNIAGGLHHAMASRASGFCYINDPVVAIKKLLAKGKRVAYVDIDAHHGDGVEAAFANTDKVLTISIHESGRYLFPGTGFSSDIGVKAGKGYSINLPLEPYSDDYVFLAGFDAIVPPFLDAFKPDILVTQLGVDTFATDPITHLNLTTNGFEEMVKRFKSFGIAWVALGGGGYNIDNVKRAWTIAWAVMSGQSVPASLRDEEAFPMGAGSRQRDTLLKEVDFLLESVLPLVKGP